MRRQTCVRSLRRIGSPCRIGGATYYPLTDVQGTVWGYVDANNSIVARFEYDAWGNILSATSSVPALARNRYRFQCREWSEATGLVNFRARWYDSVTGRWLSANSGICFEDGSGVLWLDAGSFGLTGDYIYRFYVPEGVTHPCQFLRAYRDGREVAR